MVDVQARPADACENTEAFDVGAFKKMESNFQCANRARGAPANILQLQAGGTLIAPCPAGASPVFDAVRRRTSAKFLTLRGQFMSPCHLNQACSVRANAGGHARREAERHGTCAAFEPVRPCRNLLESPTLTYHGRQHTGLSLVEQEFMQGHGLGVGGGDV